MVKLEVEEVVFRFLNSFSRLVICLSFSHRKMIASDLLILLITDLVSLYPVSKLVKYRDRKKVEIR